MADCTVIAIPGVLYSTRQDKTSDTDHTIDNESLSLRLSDTEVTVFKSKLKNLSSW